MYYMHIAISVAYLTGACKRQRLAAKITQVFNCRWAASWKAILTHVARTRSSTRFLTFTWSVNSVLYVRSYVDEMAANMCGIVLHIGNSPSALTRISYTINLEPDVEMERWILWGWSWIGVVST